MLEKIGNFTATESLGPDPSADMLFLFFICCASSQQPQTADVLTLKTEIKPDGTFFRLPPLHRVGFVGARDSRAPIVELWLSCCSGEGFRTVLTTFGVY